MIPKLELIPQGIGYYCQIGESVLILLPSNVPGIVGAATTDEKYINVCGGDYLPGLIYKEDYYPMTTPVRVGLTALDNVIPDNLKDYSRFLDMRNGGVIRWNDGFVDDYGTAEVLMLDDRPHIRYDSGLRAINIDLTNVPLINKIIRENTGLMILDDIDFLKYMLMMGLCVTWMGGKMFEYGSTVLGYVLAMANATDTAQSVARLWDLAPSDICGRCWFPSETVQQSFSLSDFADYVGLRKETERRKCFRPATRPITRVHWCSKEHSRLEMFKNIGNIPYVQGSVVARCLSFYEMADLADIRDKLLAALELPRQDAKENFVASDYVKSKIPISF